jgi:predicted nucleic acid-binding protein
VICYLDTSAAMKLLVEEPESASLADYFAAPTTGSEPVSVVASWLLHTELHCAAQRHPGDVDAEAAEAVLDAVSLVDLTRGDVLTAGALPGRLRSEDALHLAVALRLGVDEMITYDDELAQAATAAGITVKHPA